MSKEKQIEEMAVIINKSKHDMWEGICKFENHSEIIAEYLYTAGYRKQSEVARKIFEEIEKLSYRFMNDKHYIFGDMVGDIAELKSRYTEAKVCTDCKHFVGCECFDGKTCDLYTEGGEG